MIVPGFAWAAISRTASSMAVMLVALPAPSPKVLVGVLTARKTMSACDMRVESQVKNRLGWRLRVPVVFVMGLLFSISVLSLVARTTLIRPGSWTGRCGDVHFWMRWGSRSRTLTVIVGLFSARTAAVGPPVQISKAQFSHSQQRQAYLHIPHPRRKHSSQHPMQQGPGKRYNQNQENSTNATKQGRRL